MVCFSEYSLCRAAFLAGAWDRRQDSQGSDATWALPGTRRGSIMDFYAVLDQILALLRQRGRVSYRALKRQFDLDDAYLDDLKMELIEVHQCAVEQDGTMLVWIDAAMSAAAPAPV